ncbi:MAG: NADH:ubiquinone reductase (Na(+)-transporting) subunit C [Bacteroidales bacterium]|nr:NADH:ubiquinone reductase (Na(+)-transporting) subunit C [Bacteroidales bacterium]
MKQTNTYIFIYASVMVIIVAAILSFTAEKLKPIQENNVKIEKIQNILSSVGIQSTKENAEEMFNKYIPESNRIVIGADGNVKEGQAAFDIDLKKELAKPENQRSLPLFVATLDNGENKAIVPLLGKGLWGPIWGYLAFNDDYNTIFGAVFDHKGETPGLGADINKEWFQKPFIGKTIFDGSQFVSIAVHKGGHGAAERAGDTKHGVDAISGGTITSKGLQAMLKDCLGNYVNYFNNHKK